MRLQKPSFCPGPIATLLDNCFSELPEKRPTFQEIKSDLDTAYNNLLRNQLDKNTKDKENPQTGQFPSIDLINNSMKLRYTAMIKGNKEQMKRNGSLGSKSNQYLSMKKIDPRRNSVTLEVDVISKREYLKLIHPNKCQGDNNMAVKGIEANQSFNYLELKEQSKSELRRSLSEPKKINTYIISKKIDSTL